MTTEATEAPKQEITEPGDAVVEQEKKEIVEDVIKIEDQINENVIKPEGSPKKVRRQNPETEEYNYYYSDDENAKQQPETKEEKPNTEVSLKNSLFGALNSDKPAEKQETQNQDAGETLAEKLLDNNNPPPAENQQQPAEQPPTEKPEENKEQPEEKQENNEKLEAPIQEVLQEKLRNMDPNKKDDDAKENQNQENQNENPQNPENAAEQPKEPENTTESAEKPAEEPQNEVKPEEQQNNEQQPAEPAEQLQQTEDQSLHGIIQEKLLGKQKDEPNPENTPESQQQNEENKEDNNEQNAEQTQEPVEDQNPENQVQIVEPNENENQQEGQNPQENPADQQSPEDKELEEAMDDMINKFQAPPPHLRARIRQIISHRRVDAIVAGQYEQAELQDRYERALAISLQAEQDRANEDNRIDLLYARYVKLQEQLQDINQKYDDEIKACNDNSQHLLDQLKEKHAQELDEFTKKWNDEKFLLQFNKPSSKLLQLREMEKARALSRLYQKAKEIKIIADRLQNEETQAAQRRINAQMEFEKKKLLARQEKEIKSNEEHRAIVIQNKNLQRETETRPVQVAIAQIRAKKGTIVVAGKPSSQAVTRDFADADKSPLSPRTHEKLNNYRAVKPKPRLSVHGAVESKPNSPKNRPKSSTIKRPFTSASHRGKFTRK